MNDDAPLINTDATQTPTEPLPPPQPSALRKVFVGKDGLRAGWSLVIFIAILAAMFFCVNVIGRKLYPPPPRTAVPQELSPLFAVFAELLPFLIVLLVTWIMSKIERRPIGTYGLGGQRKFPLFFAGLVWGLATLSLLILILRGTGLLVFDSRLLSGSDILRYGVIWLVGFLMVGLLEEYMTRGYLQFTLTRGLAGLYQAIFKTRHSEALGFWTSALIFSILFGLGHRGNPGESPIGLLSAGSAGLVFCFSLWRTRSLWWAIGFHTSWDWAQSFLYGVPDSGLMVQHHLLATHPVGKPILSGGTTGPEGSIYVVAILALIAVIIVLTLSRPKTAASISAPGSAVS